MKLTLQKIVMMFLFIGTIAMSSTKVHASTNGFGFTGNFTTVISGLKVTFTDSSSTFGNPVWKWYFGDGDSSSTKNPTHTYLQGGSYKVVMVVREPTYGYWDTVRKTITISYMTFVSSSVTQSNTKMVSRSSTNQEILCIKIQMSATGKAIPLTKLKLNTKGTTSASSDISNARIWYTGNVSSFATTTQFGATTANPNGGLSFSGSTNLKTGNNYFWLTYDIDSGATLLDTVDAKVDSVVVNTMKHVPTNSAPSGYRVISDCNADYIYSVSGTSVTFTNQSSSSNPSTASYLWDFGDSDSSTQQSPVHQYANAGSYSVLLTLYNTGISCFDTIRKTIVISSCNASYTDSTNGNDVDFINTSSSINSATASYSWSFGDSTANDTNLNTRHTFAQNGTYYVCLTIYDNGCSDTYCKQITINVQSSCNANFSDSVATGTYDVYFTDNSTSSASRLDYSWDFGDGGSSTQQNPMHGYATAGQYYVCLTISDQATNCSDQYCSYITVSAIQLKCHADFSYQLNQKQISFTDLSTGMKSNTSYYWDFGDGNTSTSHNPKHTYASYNIYTVCLYIHDSDCSDSLCVGIAVTENYAISGTVYLGNTTNPADYGMVWAIHFDSSSSSLAAFDSAQIDSGGRYTLHVPPSYYLVKAALESSSSNYSNYLPTYYNDKLHWDTANLIALTTDVAGVDIHLIGGNNPGGPGFIEGYTSQGANKTEAIGDPVSGVEIVLYDNQKNPIAYTISDSKGYFSFSNLKYGTYSVHPEMVGKLSTPLSVTLSSSHAVQKGLVVEVNRFYVNVNYNTSVSNPDLNMIYSMYPNPTSYILNVVIDENIKYNYTIQVYDIQGRAANVSAVKEGNKAQLNIASLPAGIYILSLQTKEGEVYRQRFTKE